MFANKIYLQNMLDMVNTGILLTTVCLSQEIREMALMTDRKGIDLLGFGEDGKIV